MTHFALWGGGFRESAGWSYGSEDRNKHSILWTLKTELKGTKSEISIYLENGRGSILSVTVAQIQTTRISTYGHRTSGCRLAPDDDNSTKATSCPMHTCSSYPQALTLFRGIVPSNRTRLQPTLTPEPTNQPFNLRGKMGCIHLPPSFSGKVRTLDSPWWVSWSVRQSKNCDTSRSTGWLIMVKKEQLFRLAFSRRLLWNRTYTGEKEERERERERLLLRQATFYDYADYTRVEPI